MKPLLIKTEVPEIHLHAVAHDASCFSPFVPSVDQCGEAGNVFSLNISHPWPQLPLCQPFQNKVVPAKTMHQDCFNLSLFSHVLHLKKHRCLEKYSDNWCMISI